MVSIIARNGINIGDNGKTFCEKHGQSLFYIYWKSRDLAELICQMCEDEDLSMNPLQSSEKEPDPKRRTD